MGSVADDDTKHFQAMRCTTMFGEVDALPGAEPRRPATTGTLRFTPVSIARIWAGMSSGPLVVMGIMRILGRRSAHRASPSKSVFTAAAAFSWMRSARRSMAAEEREKSIAHAPRAYPLGDLMSDRPVRVRGSGSSTTRSPDATRLSRAAFLPLHIVPAAHAVAEHLSCRRSQRSGRAAPPASRRDNARWGRCRDAAGRCRRCRADARHPPRSYRPQRRRASDGRAWRPRCGRPCLIKP